MTSSKPTVAENLIEALESLSISTIFGNPGTTELPFVKAVAASTIDYRLALHEDVAMGAAAGYASLSRYPDFRTEGPPLGVVNLHTSGGLAHGLANVYGARSARVPVLVIVGTQSTNFRHEEPILSDDCETMLQQFCRWTGEITNAESATPMLKKAIRNALTPPAGPSGLMLPLNVAQARTEPTNFRLGDVPQVGDAEESALTQLTNRLRRTDELCLVVGDEIGRHGRDTVRHVIDLAEETEAVVFGEILMSECNFPTDHDQWVSVIPPDRELARQLLDFETVIFLGCNQQTALFESAAPLVSPDSFCAQLNASPGDTGRSQHVDLALAGNISDSVTSLISRLEGTLDDVLLKQRRQLKSSVEALVEMKLEELGNSPASSENCTQRNVVETLNEVEEDFFLVDEGVTGRYELLTQGVLKPERYVSNKGGALGYGLPASIGAGLAIEESDRSLPVVAYVGDGSFWYYPQSLHTAARYSLNLTVIVLSNERYQILEDNAEQLLGAPPDFDSTRLPGLDSVSAGKAQTVDSYRVKQREAFEHRLKRELNNPSPSLIEVDLVGEEEP